MQYISTRGYEEKFTAAEAILQGIAPDGGLFVPESIPQLKARDWERLKQMDYAERAVFILSLFTDFSAEDLREAVQEAYSELRFDPEPAPLVQLNPYSDRDFMLELWHGPTSAFKDLALQLLPHLMRLSMEETGTEEDYCILTATSGDTGKAALEGFRDMPRTSVIVFYPTDGVSDMQKLQMQTQRGENCHVFAVDGSFDDAQSEVKKLFADEALQAELAEDQIKLSSANSINWGRLLPQIVYYCSVYAEFLKRELLEEDERYDIVVPSGNFGNILAAWYSMQMGAPAGTLYCASNRNHVLTDFLRRGKYDRKRKFYKTNTPSMDILVSSNMERLLFELTDHDAEKVKSWMQALNENGEYKVDNKTLSEIKKSFKAAYAEEHLVIRTITDVYNEFDHVVDTHTAVGFAAERLLNSGQKKKDRRKTVYVATASPFKFPDSVCRALFGKKAYKNADDKEMLEAISEESDLEIPQGLAELFDLPIRHDTVIKKDEMRDAVIKALSSETHSAEEAPAKTEGASDSAREARQVPDAEENGAAEETAEAGAEESQETAEGSGAEESEG